MLRCVTFALLCATSLNAQNAIDPSVARTYFAELRELGAKDAGLMWGRRVDGPMFFVDPATRKIAANMPDTAGLLKQEGGVWTGTLPDSMNIANTAVKFAGRRWSMVMWPVSDSRYARRRLLVHENFHRIQDELGLVTIDRGNSHMATAEGRIWTRLEWRALTEALLRTGADRKNALRDALTFRARRQSEFADARDDERLLELNEGLAEYTGFALSGLPRSALYDRIAVQLANYEQQDNFARSFAYASGPAYALLLDASGVDWRRKLNKTSDITELAAKAYGISRLEPKSAESLVTKYTGERMIADERRRESVRLAQEEKFREKFVNGSVLTLPVGKAFSYSYDPNGALPLQDVGTVFESARVTDDWGVLIVSSGGILLRRTNGLISSVIVSVPAGANQPVKGDGWELTLSPGWSVSPGPRAGDWIVKSK